MIMKMRGSLVGAWAAVLATCPPAFADTAPLGGRLAFMAMPLAPPALGAEFEVGLRSFPLTLGLRSIGTFPSLPMPAYQSVMARTTPVHPNEGPAFGLLGAAALLSMTFTPAGTTTNYAFAAGLTYQQAWGSVWLRLSPNVMFPLDLMATLMIAPPWLEVGYNFGGIDVSLRSTATPLGLTFRF